MTFKDLQIGDYFIFPNHIPTRGGIPFPENVDELEVFQKIQPATFDNEILCMRTKFVRGVVGGNTKVIKLIF